jgi:hypothetical protein
MAGQRPVPQRTREAFRSLAVARSYSLADIRALPNRRSTRLLKLPRKEGFSLLPSSSILVTLYTYALEDAPPSNDLSYT